MGDLPPNGVSRRPRPGKPRARRETGEAPAQPPLPCGRPASGPGLCLEAPAGAGWDSSGKFWPHRGLGWLGRRQTERGPGDWGTVALGTAGVSGEPVALTALHPARLEGRVWGSGLGTGTRRGCGCGDCRGSRAAAPGEGGSGRNARWALGEAPRSRGRRRSREARERARQKVSEPPPSPPSAPKPRAGERDPCPDPSPRPARAITKETRPPALPAPRRLKTDPSAGTGRQKGCF